MDELLAFSDTTFLINKDHAYYVSPEKNTDVFKVDIMKQFKHIFLFRHPKFSLESFYRTT